MSNEIKPMKIVKVTATEFETEDGQIFDHPYELEVVPSVEEFQKIHDGICSTMNNILGDCESDE